MSHPPTLLIVMGTSGSGKSTVSTALSAALSCPFVDGDDLHPPSNVAKMSGGHPLNDSDREPWLLTIRRTGLALATGQMNENDIAKHGGSPLRPLAEVLETSKQSTNPIDHLTHAHADADAANLSSSSSQRGSKHQIAIIACSSLKLVYRRLLRGSIKSLDDPQATQPETEAQEPNDLKVIHIYLDLTRHLLEERMAARKGHFMKLDMLYSQLDTLQVPQPTTEPGVVVVKVERDTTTEAIVRDAIAQLRSQHIVT